MSKLFVVKSTEKVFTDSEGRESSSFTIKLAPVNALGVIPKAEKCWYVRTGMIFAQGEVIDIEFSEWDEEIVPFESPTGPVNLRWLSPK